MEIEDEMIMQEIIEKLNIYGMDGLYFCYYYKYFYYLCRWF